ncbi:MAG: nuclear transport factor 2 family protein [Pseudomonadota bacterium]
MRGLLSFLTLCALSSIASATADVERLCERTLEDYAWYSDHPDPEAYGKLFTEDAVLDVFGPNKGREAIVARHKNNAKQRRFIHLLSNVRVDIVSTTEARATSYVEVYTVPLGDGPHTVAGFAGIGEYHDELRISEAGCQIAKRKLHMRVLHREYKP